MSGTRTPTDTNEKGARNSVVFISLLTSLIMFLSALSEQYPDFFFWIPYFHTTTVGIMFFYFMGVVFLLLSIKLFINWDIRSKK